MTCGSELSKLCVAKNEEWSARYWEHPACIHMSVEAPEAHVVTAGCWKATLRAM